MNLIYEQGDIVFFRNVIFEDSDGKERLDIRTAGHPFLILNDVKDFGDTCLALKITSRRLTYIKQYHLGPVSAKPKLRKDSFVNQTVDKPRIFYTWFYLYLTKVYTKCFL